MQRLSLPFSWHPDVMIGREAHNLPVWDQSSIWWRVYGGQSAEKYCKGECQCEPHFARQFALQPWVCPSICHSECWKEWQCDTTLRVVSHYHSFQHSEWQIEVQTHCWRANWRAKWGSQWHSPLQFFSALCPPYTLHQSLLWSHTGRLYAALKMSPD